MKKEALSLVIGFVLIIALIGYMYQLLTKSVDANFTLLFMLQILIVYLLLENIKSK